MVHTNQQLTPVQKLQYLRNSLSDEPEAFIRHLCVTNKNYEPAWQLLCKRYDNNRAIAQEITQKFWSLSTVGLNDHLGLKHLLDNTSQLLAGIKMCKQEHKICKYYHDHEYRRILGHYSPEFGKVVVDTTITRGRVDGIAIRPD
jgi:hypothetical protein